MSVVEDWALVGRLRAETQLTALHRLPLLPVPTLALAAGCYLAFGLIAWAWLAGVIPAWASIPLAAPLFYASFTVLHDGTHRAISRSPLLNEIIGTLGGQLLMPGMEVGVYRILHLEHHKHTGEKHEDPDDVMVIAPKWALPFVLGFIDVIWFFWYLRRAGRFATSQNIRFVAGFMLNAAWHVAWLASPYAGEWLIVWLLPQRLGLLIVAYLFAHIQHPPEVEQRERPIHATAMITRNPLTRFLMLGQSAHLIHHLYPQLPFYRLEAGWDAAAAAREPHGRLWRGIGGSVKRFVPPPSPAERHWIAARVAEVERQTPNITSFVLEAADGGPLPAFAAGAHIDLRLASGLVRQYSLVGRPGAAAAYRIAVKRDDAGRGGSCEVHRTLVPGARLDIGRPRNHFPLRPGSGRAVLVAGGIGLTPLLAMAAAMAAEHRDFVLRVCARSRAELPFAAWFDQAPFAGRTRIHLDDGARFDPARDLGAPGAGDQLYLCGPAGFMAWAKGAAAGLGWPAEAVFWEDFAPAGGPGDAFIVDLSKSRRVIDVAAGQSIVEALEARRLPTETLCRQGVCGTCRCKVLAGTIEHRDSVLTPEERAAGDQMMTCVSRAPKGERLVLDL
jgi:vanillate O-demethylase ferredoxin subunit